jgi:hypothetical protein
MEITGVKIAWVDVKSNKYPQINIISGSKPILYFGSRKSVQLNLVGGEFAG